MSTLILPFDTETTGLPNWKERSESPNQPHMVQLAAILCDGVTGKVKDEFEVIVKPNGWVISEEMTEIHGISMELAMDVGTPEVDALQMFLDLYNVSDLRVAHGTTFDNRIIRIALKRYFPELIPDEEWKNKAAYYCTLINSRKLMGGKSGHTLEEAYLHFTGNKLENAHSAMADARACKEIYFAING